MEGEPKKGGRKINPEALAFAEELLLRPIRDMRIAKMVGDKFQLSPRHSRRIVQRAYEAIRARRAKVQPYATERIEGIFWDILERATAKGDFKAQIGAADRLAKLSNAYAPVRVQHSGSIGAAVIPPDMPTAERRKRLDELLAERERRRAGQPFVEVVTPVVAAAAEAGAFDADPDELPDDLPEGADDPGDVDGPDDDEDAGDAS